MKKEAVMTIVKDGRLEAVVWHDPQSKHQVFYRCEEMGDEDIQSLYEENITDR